MDSRRKGAIGVAKAISYFTEQGYAVFVPVSDVSRYDLIVETGGQVLRVEVKTTSTSNDQVQLRTACMYGTGPKSKFISEKDCDLVFCYNITSGNFKLFEASEIAGRTTVTIH